MSCIHSVDSHAANNIRYMYCPGGDVIMMSLTCSAAVYEVCIRWGKYYELFKSLSDSLGWRRDGGKINWG